MKIEVTKPGTKQFYDEMLFVLSNYKSFIKKPTKKPKQLTKYILSFLICFAILLVAFTWLYFQEYSLTDAIFMGIFLILILLYIAYDIRIFRVIKQYMSDTTTKVITIENDDIEFEKPGVNFKVRKDEIAVIIINKYSICFLPKDNNAGIIISISTEYREEVLKGLEENDYMSLVVDNFEKK